MKPWNHLARFSLLTLAGITVTHNASAGQQALAWQPADSRDTLIVNSEFAGNPPRTAALCRARHGEGQHLGTVDKPGQCTFAYGEFVTSLYQYEVLAAVPQAAPYVFGWREWARNPVLDGLFAGASENLGGQTVRQYACNARVGGEVLGGKMLETEPGDCYVPLRSDNKRPAFEVFMQVEDGSPLATGLRPAGEGGTPASTLRRDYSDPSQVSSTVLKLCSAARPPAIRSVPPVFKEGDDFKIQGACLRLPGAKAGDTGSVRFRFSGSAAPANGLEMQVVEWTPDVITVRIPGGLPRINNGPVPIEITPRYSGQTARTESQFVSSKNKP